MSLAALTSGCKGASGPRAWRRATRRPKGHEPDALGFFGAAAGRRWQWRQLTSPTVSSSSLCRLKGLHLSLSTFIGSRPLHPQLSPIQQVASSPGNLDPLQRPLPSCPSPSPKHRPRFLCRGMQACLEAAPPASLEPGLDLRTCTLLYSSCAYLYSVAWLHRFSVALHSHYH